ncbi:MAG: nucleotidyltransferase family protein [Woeseiaceae bacterium]
MKNISEGTGPSPSGSHAFSGITLVVLAAGSGSRFGGLKQLAPLGPAGNVLLEYSIYDAMRAGFSKIVLVIRRSCVDQFTKALINLPKQLEIRFVFQEQLTGAPGERSKPWGTAHALLAARRHVTEPFVLCNADDYYGTSAFRRAADYLLSEPFNPDRYGMLAYTLCKTLPKQGEVSRGLCHLTDAGQLDSIVEHLRISVSGDDIISADEHGNASMLHESDIASMNFWMFAPSVFPRLQASFESFARRSGQDPCAEFQLPTFISDLLHRGEIAVDCVPHDEAWFGLTYREDHDRAAKTIQQLHDAGLYPAPLWQSVPGDR